MCSLYFKRFEDLLSIPISSSQSPIVYSPTYDIALIGIEKWYPFDTCKASKIFNHLKGNLTIHFLEIILLKLISFKDCFIEHF